MQWKTRPLGYFSYTVLCCLCERGDQIRSLPAWVSQFQFTPLREGRHWAPSGLSRISYFNSRPCERGDKHSFVFAWLHFLFQFTPLREGRPMPQANMGIKLAISIHAPARGATLQRSEYIGGNRFQFTPLREGRLQQLRLAAVSPLFQFTPLREGRRTVSSTRACLPLFQFTPLREGRHGSRRRSRAHEHFNSRPCERGDPAPATAWRIGSYFNSRPCERGDAKHILQHGKHFRFQFTPLREGRLGKHALAKRSYRISIHAPARGATIRMEAWN